MSRLDEIAERLDAATPGPWRLNQMGEPLIVAGGCPIARVHDDASVGLILSAPADLAALLAVARAAQHFMDGGVECYSVRIVPLRGTEPCGNCPPCVLNAALAALDGAEVA